MQVRVAPYVPTPRYAAAAPAPPLRRSRTYSRELISDHENWSLIALLCSGTRNAACAPAQGRRAHRKIANPGYFPPSCGRKVSKIPAFKGSGVVGQAAVRARFQMSLHSAHTASGMTPSRISPAKTLQPRQYAKTDSRVAATTSSPNRP